MQGPKITPTDDGPYLVEGPVTIVDAEGSTPYEVVEQTRIFLCRCGGSGTKPFCDGTHETLGFQATHRALPAPRSSSARAAEPEEGVAAAAI